MSTRVDYDTIAHLYDEPRRDHAPDRRLEAFGKEHHGTNARTVRVLDVGCGTGKQLAANRARFGNMTLVGVDRSAGMLRIARDREADVAWVQGDAQALPLGSGTVDYATNQFSYPHIGNKPRFAAEIFHELRPGGRFVLTNIDPWAMEQWIIYGAGLLVGFSGGVTATNYTNPLQLGKFAAFTPADFLLCAARQVCN